MTSNFQTSKQSFGQTLAPVPNRKRNRSEAPLILVLMIGACAAGGIIIFANGDQSEMPSHGAPTMQLDGQR